MTHRFVTNVEATYRVTTPMFCGGADPAAAELRLPSFKGVLRFWWRALAWSRLGGDLERIRKEEAGLFGSADGGQSRVVMSMRPPRTHTCEKREVLTEAGSGRPVGAGVRYLGYGLMEAFSSRPKGTRAGELTRPCLRAPFDFTVRMTLRNTTASNSRRDASSLRNALVALGTLGGLGARARKGFGSLALRSLLIDGAPQWNPLSSRDELLARIKAFYGDGSGGPAVSSLPPFTALSNDSRHVLVNGARVNALQLLDLLGREQVRYRSWGRHDRVLGNVRSEKNFKGDHDLMKQVPRQRNAHPERIAFGLPHNYSGRNGTVGPERFDRRASPLFIHIHECGGEAVAVVSFLPADFLPKGKRKISVGGKSIDLVAEAKLYEPIHDFLDRLLDSRRRREPITAKEVLP